jgi:hypothetical protein
MDDIVQWIDIEGPGQRSASETEQADSDETACQSEQEYFLHKIR